MQPLFVSRPHLHRRPGRLGAAPTQPLVAAATRAMPMSLLRPSTLVLAMCCAVSVGVAAEATVPETNPLRNAYFGETHLHTAFSLDAYIGGARLMPADSLRYARGEPVTLDDGSIAQHKRPLDFAAVTDHAEYIGEMYSTMYDDAPGHDNDDLKTLRELTDIGQRQQWFFKYVISSNRSSTPQHPTFYAGPATTASAFTMCTGRLMESDASITLRWPANANIAIAIGPAARPMTGNRVTLPTSEMTRPFGSQARITKATTPTIAATNAIPRQASSTPRLTRSSPVIWLRSRENNATAASKNNATMPTARS